MEKGNWMRGISICSDVRHNQKGTSSPMVERYTSMGSVGDTVSPIYLSSPKHSPRFRKLIPRSLLHQLHLTRTNGLQIQRLPNLPSRTTQLSNRKTPMPPRYSYQLSILLQPSAMVIARNRIPQRFNSVIPHHRVPLNNDLNPALAPLAIGLMSLGEGTQQRMISSLLQWHKRSVMGLLGTRSGVVRPENGNVMSWLSSLVSRLPSPLTREWPRPGKPVVLLWYGLAGGSGVELGGFAILHFFR